MQLIAVTTTMDEEIDAKLLASEVFESRLAACAQIDRIESVYSWKGSLQTVGEFRITFKTRSTLWRDLKAEIQKSHPYEIPAIYSFEVAGVCEQYSEWVVQNTREPAP